MMRLLVACVASIVLLAPLLARAQPSERAQPPSTTITDAAIREYASVGAPGDGMTWMLCEVVVFDADWRATGIPGGLLEQTIKAIAPDVTMGVLRPVSIRPIGDEVVAKAGTLNIRKDADSETQNTPAAIISFRDGRFVYLLLGHGTTTNPLQTLADIGEKLVGRTARDYFSTVTADGLHLGGVWDLLPGLEDMPEGFVVASETVPAWLQAFKSTVTPTPTEYVPVPPTVATQATPIPRPAPPTPDLLPDPPANPTAIAV